LHFAELISKKNIFAEAAGEDQGFVDADEFNEEECKSCDNYDFCKEKFELITKEESKNRVIN